MAVNQKIELVKGGKKVDGVFQPRPVEAAPAIPLDGLTSTETPAKVTPPPTPTQATGMLGELQSGADAFTQNLQAQTELRQKDAEATKSSYASVLEQMKGGTTKTAEEYAKQGGVDNIETELNTINQQILQEQVGLQRQLEQLDKNSGGGLAAGVDAERRRVERESLRKQADLSIIQMGVQGRYDSAKAVADRAVSAYMENQQIQLDAAKFNYEENKGLYNKAEQREFETKLASRERDITQIDSTTKAIYDQLFAAGAMTPDRLSLVSESMKEANDAMEKGLSPRAALTKMQGALSGVVSPQQQQVALQYAQLEWQKKSFQMQLNAKAEEIMSEKAKADATTQETNGLKVDKALVISSLAKELKTDAGFDNAVGPNMFTRLGTPFSGDKQNFIDKAERLANLLTIENMGVLKGPASDRDVALIMEAASTLSSREVSEADYAAEIQRVYDAAMRIANTYGVTDEQLVAYGYMIPAEVQAANEEWARLGATANSTKNQ